MKTRYYIVGFLLQCCIYSFEYKWLWEFMLLFKLNALQNHLPLFNIMQVEYAAVGGLQNVKSPYLQSLQAL